MAKFKKVSSKPKAPEQSPVDKLLDQYDDATITIRELLTKLMELVQDDDELERIVTEEL